MSSGLMDGEVARATRVRAALFVVVEPDETLRRRLVETMPRAWLYWPAADAASARRALGRFAVAGAIVSQDAPEAAPLVAEFASRAVPVVVLARSDVAAWRERGALATIPHPALVPDSAVSLAARLEEMALLSWAEGVEA